MSLWRGSKKKGDAGKKRMSAIETLLAALVFASTIVVLALLYSAVKYRTVLTSEKAKQEVMRRKTIFRTAFFLGVLALGMFIIWELFEALEALNIVSLGEEVERVVEVFQMAAVLTAQILIFYVVAEVKKHGA